MSLSPDLGTHDLASDGRTPRLGDSLELSPTRLGVIGMGFTGLPVAVALAELGFVVVSIDRDETKVANVRGRHSHIADVTDEALCAVRERLTATVDYAALRNCDAVFVCVPTPLDEIGLPDLSSVTDAFTSLARHVQPDTLVVLQSTVPPGTTRACAKRLADASGLELGVSLFVAFAPERIDPGNTNGWSVQNTPRVVGGVTRGCTSRAASLLRQLCRSAHEVESPEVAELAKLLENTFRLVNLTFINEFADVCRDLAVPVKAVIKAAETKPFGWLTHHPGPGIGGECIPVDSAFLLSSPRRGVVTMPLVATAYQRSTQRPHDVAQFACEMVQAEGARVLLVGVSYKRNVSDLRNAPALTVWQDLEARGAIVSHVDQLCPRLLMDGRERTTLTNDEVNELTFDLAILVTDHDELIDAVRWERQPAVLDTRHALPAAHNVRVL